jgi:hypothetical protein
MPHPRRPFPPARPSADPAALARRGLLALAATAGLAACGRKPDILQVPPPEPETPPQEAPR